MKHLSDLEIDALPKYVHSDTPERLKQRRAWGVRVGRRARMMDIPKSDNPFTSNPVMPMRGGWISGWEERDLEMRNAQ